MGVVIRGGGDGGGFYRDNNNKGGGLLKIEIQRVNQPNFALDGGGGGEMQREEG